MTDRRRQNDPAAPAMTMVGRCPGDVWRIEERKGGLRGRAGLFD